MPYIVTERRPQYDQQIETLARTLANQDKNDPRLLVGDLTYVIYRLLVLVCGTTDANFARRATVEAAAHRAMREFARRHIDPYEDGAILRNGDVNATL